MELVTNVPSLNGDALLALGPDAAANLDTVYQENCPNGLDSPNCLTSLQEAMSVDQQVLEKRIVPVIIAFGVFGAYLGFQYAQIEKHEKAIRRIRTISSMRIPSANLAKISPYQGSGTMVFETQTAGGDQITVIPSPIVTG